MIFSLPYVAPSGETEAHDEFLEALHLPSQPLQASTLCTVQLANVLQAAQNDLVEVRARVVEMGFSDHRVKHLPCLLAHCMF